MYKPDARTRKQLAGHDDKTRYTVARIFTDGVILTEMKRVEIDPEHIAYLEVWHIHPCTVRLYFADYTTTKENPNAERPHYIEVHAVDALAYGLEYIGASLCKGPVEQHDLMVLYIDTLDANKVYHRYATLPEILPMGYEIHLQPEHYTAEDATAEAYARRFKNYNTTVITHKLQES